MEIRSDTIELSPDASFGDLFKLYESRAFREISKKEKLIIKNAFYMGLNAALTLLNDVPTTERLSQLQIDFETYHAELLGSH